MEGKERKMCIIFGRKINDIIFYKNFFYQKVKFFFHERPTHIQQTRMIVTIFFIGPA